MKFKNRVFIVCLACTFIFLSGVVVYAFDDLDTETSNYTDPYDDALFDTNGDGIEDAEDGENIPPEVIFEPVE